jgi:hypothetical protein
MGPLNEKCLTSNVVYKAEITTPHDGTSKEYIGMTSTEFKVRYINHKKSFISLGTHLTQNFPNTYGI